MADFKDFESTDKYLDLLDRLSDINDATAQQLSVGSHSNIPTGAMRYNKSQKRWETYNGTSWGQTASQYSINVKQLQGAEPKTSPDNNSIAKRTSAGQLKASDPSASDEATTKGWADSRYAHVSNNLSDLNNVATARNNLKLGSAATVDTGTKSTQVPTNNDLGDLRTKNSGKSNGVTVQFADTADKAAKIKIGANYHKAGTAAQKDTGTGGDELPTINDLGNTIFGNPTELTGSDDLNNLADGLYYGNKVGAKNEPPINYYTLIQTSRGSPLPVQIAQDAVGNMFVRGFGGGGPSWHPWKSVMTDDNNATDLKGNWPMSRVTGNFPMSRVTGKKNVGWRGSEWTRSTLGYGSHSYRVPSGYAITGWAAYDNGGSHGNYNITKMYARQMETK